MHNQRIQQAKQARYDRAYLRRVERHKVRDERARGRRDVLALFLHIDR